MISPLRLMLTLDSDVCPTVSRSSAWHLRVSEITSTSAIHTHARGARISLRLRRVAAHRTRNTPPRPPTTHPTSPTMTLHFRVVCALLHSATLVCAIPYTQPISGAPKVKLKVSATASVPVQCSEPTVVVCVHVCVHVHVCTMLAARPARLPLSLAGSHHAQGARACDRQRLRGDRLCD